MADCEYTFATCAAATFDGLRILHACDQRRADYETWSRRPDTLRLNVSGSQADLLRHGLISDAMLAGMGDARVKSFGGRRKGTCKYTEIRRNTNGTLRIVIYASGPDRAAIHARVGFSVEQEERIAAMAETRARTRSALMFEDWATLQ